MFTFAHELELHEHIVQNFNNYFDFDYVSSEFIISSGRVDIVGRNNETIYIIEIKKDKVTDSTISQLYRYVLDVQESRPDSIVRGIAVAPKINANLNLSNIPPEITIQPIEDVKYVKPKSLSIKSTVEPLSTPKSRKKAVTYSIEESTLDDLRAFSLQTMTSQASFIEQAIKEKLEEMESAEK